MYAVVKVGGKQYRVSEGKVLVVEKLKENPGEVVTFEEVLLLVKDSEVQIGEPFLVGTCVTGKVLEQVKGKKIRVARFKAKVRHRRVKGFRPRKTRVLIEKILTPKTQTAKKEKAKR